MSSLKVLIIDDSEIDRYILARQLKKAGIVDVKQQDSALEALGYIKSLADNEMELPPDLIILDINMPKMNGFEFLESTQNMFARGYLSECKVVMYSAADEPSEQKQAQRFTAVKGFLAKGSTPEDVQNLLSALF